MVFPFDFGFIPGTKDEDGDPLDIIIISELTSFTGCGIECKIIGAIKAKQTEKDKTTVENDRYIGLPLVCTLYEKINSIEHLPKN